MNSLSEGSGRPAVEEAAISLKDDAFSASNKAELQGNWQSISNIDSAG